MRVMQLAVALVVALGTSNAWSAPPRLTIAAPGDLGLDAAKLQQIDTIVAQGLANKQMPGCVVLVGHQGKIAWLKAYGDKRLEPQREAMTTDTVFDLASLTKPIATATSAMKLTEDGKIKLAEQAATYLPEFGTRGKEKITVEQLFTHQGGLIADNALSDYLDGPEKAWERIFALKLASEPGTKFVYSDVSFEVLGKIVERVSGQNLNEFSRDKLFAPLGMTETAYLPSEKLKARAAPTQQRNEQWMQGEVHDPRAYHLGGVAGHAGLFSTAEDLAVYAQMLLNRGEYGGVRVLKAETVDAMFTAREVAGGGRRALGWDVRTGFSSNRGQGLSDRAVGHGGFTGTVLWIDPELDLFYIFLSNRVHPNGKGNVNKLAGEIGTAVAGSLVK
ncbi:MAG TPA: serine hydrolase [Pirellulaceae bacterium]|nr:serine hydrolase [Pirellulaceae bacterium]